MIFPEIETNKAVEELTQLTKPIETFFNEMGKLFFIFGIYILHI